MILIAISSEHVLHRRFPTGREAGPDELETRIRSFVEGLPEPPAAIGIAAPGLVTDDNVAASDVLPRLDGWSPARKLSRYAPTYLVNDAVAALAEETHSLPAGTTAAVIMAGTGVGAAFLVQGQILHGARGWAGELGSMPIPTQDGVVTLDELAGGAALTKRLGTDADTIARRATEGDRDVLAAVEQAGRSLGLGLATVINLLNPAFVVLGGGAFRFPLYFDAAVDAARAASLPKFWEVCVVRPTTPDDLVVARGAARIAAQRQEVGGLR
jgi:predicted NBD/HSP70 family sugar kinase